MSVPTNSSSGERRAFWAIDGLLDPSPKVRDRLGKLARAMLEARAVRTQGLSNNDAISLTLSQQQSGKNRRFFAAGYLRLLSKVPQEFDRLPQDEEVAVRKLFDRMPQIAAELEIDKKAQGYERMAAYQEAAARAEKHFEQALTPETSLRAFNQVRQRVMRMYNNRLVAAIILPFLPPGLQKREISQLLEYVHDYLRADPREATAHFERACAQLHLALDDCRDEESRYVETMYLPFLESLELQLQDHYETSPLRKSGHITISPINKHYPFAIDGAEVRLGFVVDNIGAGTALDVEAHLRADINLELQTTSQFLDELGHGRSVEPVEFRANVLNEVEDSVVVECRMTWTNGDGTAGEQEAIFELPAQSTEIPWQDLEIAEPYSLEPVRDSKELIGRAAQLKQLVAKLRAPSVGSFWVHGQRRVGKTSVIKTLTNSSATKDLTFVYLETGMFIDPKADQTINNLGIKICKRLLAATPDLSGLSVPEFDGSLAPLDDFFEDALALVPSIKVVIALDEFDQLPPDLYRPGLISSALFVTLRSLSGNERLGFILIGGETMPEILSIQGQHLNKFRPLRIDYLDRSSQWSDFVELVRSPVQSWATINDDAVMRLYEVTAGNPFFTKFVCAVLMADMVQRRDAFATSREVDHAIEASVREAGINQFQHFWDDGIAFTSEAQMAREKAGRRKVLIALGEALRGGLPATIEHIADRASRFGMHEEEVERLLADFEKRKVLMKGEGELRCKVGLFERWLVDEGIHQLGLSLAEEESLRVKLQEEERRRVKNREIVALTQSWGSYRGQPVSTTDVHAWLTQFEEVEDQRLMFQLLTHVRFFSGALIRERLREAHGTVLRDLAARGIVRRQEPGARRKTDNIIVSYYGGEGKRGATIAKLYADENDIYHERIVAPRQLGSRIEQWEDVHGLVFVDDFIGTGRTAKDGLDASLEPLEDVLKDRRIDVSVVAVSGFQDAGAQIERTLEKRVDSLKVSIMEPLGESDRCFSAESRIFATAAERHRAKAIAKEKGRALSKSNPLGFGNRQALVVFDLTCPNNSLPILWADGPDGGWRPLFPRP